MCSAAQTTKNTRFDDRLQMLDYRNLDNLDRHGISQLNDKLPLSTSLLQDCFQSSSLRCASELHAMEECAAPGLEMLI